MGCSQPARGEWKSSAASTLPISLQDSASCHSKGCQNSCQSSPAEALHVTKSRQAALFSQYATLALAG